MFNEKKRMLKGKVFYLVLFVLFIFGLWLNAPLDKKPPEEISTDSSYKESTDSGIKTENPPDEDIMRNILGENQYTSAAAVTPEEEGTGETQRHDGYYLIREVDGTILIFYYDKEGKESFLGETNIAFSLLSLSDQKLFEEGIVKNTKEELNELLQDFES